MGACNALSVAFARIVASTMGSDSLHAPGALSVLLSFKFWVLALLVLQNSSKALLARSSLKVSAEPYLYSVAGLCGEGLKIVVCVVFLCFQDRAAIARLPAFVWESR